MMAIEELMLLLLEPKNQWIVKNGSLTDWIQQALRKDFEISEPEEILSSKEKKDYYAEQISGKQLSYLLPMLFGQMVIPETKTQYYHALLDLLEYSSEEYNAFMQIRTYLHEYKTLSDLEEQKVLKRIILPDGNTTEHTPDGKCPDIDLLLRLQELQKTMWTQKGNAYSVVLLEANQPEYGMLIEHPFTASSLFLSSLTDQSQLEEQARAIVRELREVQYEYYEMQKQKLLSCPPHALLQYKHLLVESQLFVDFVDGKNLGAKASMFIPAKQCLRYLEEMDRFLTVEIGSTLKHRTRWVGM